MPLVWTDRFPKRERPLGYLRLLLARYRFHTRYALVRQGRRLRWRRVPGYKHALTRWKNRYKGQRCFVLGNGPSLRSMNLAPLKDEITIGCNAVYKNFDEWGWHVNYLLFEDIEQTELRRHDIPHIKGPIKLAGLHNAYAFEADENTYFMNVRNLDAEFMEDLFPQFSDDFGHIVHLASTVTYIGLQLAFHLGCDPVYLIGVDHNYGELPKLFPPCKITITEDNLHLVQGLHLKDDYYKVGDVIGVPPVDYMEAGYAKAREVFERHGRTVLNAGVNSALDVFDRVEFASLFERPAPQRQTAEAGGPKILFISHDAGQLGAQVLLLNVVREFRRRYGWDCRIVIREPNGTLIPEFEAEGETHIFWPNPQEKRYEGHQEELKAAIEGWAPDIVYSNTTSNGDVIAYLGLDAPVVVHTHELQWYLSLLDEDRHRIFQEKTDLHIACSEAVKRNLVANHAISADAIEVVYEAIDFAALREKVSERSPSEIRVELGIPEDAILVGNCGRIDERKGWDLFIDTAERVIREAPGGTAVHFLWVGHGPNREDLLHQAQARGLADRVHAPGPQPNPFPYFNAMDIELMCSRDDPFPLVVMESAYLGCPVIAFESAGGAPEFIRDDCGIVVSEMNADALSEAVLKLVRDPKLRRRLSDNARQRAAAEFDIRDISPKIAKILHARLGLPLPAEFDETKTAQPSKPVAPEETASQAAPPRRTIAFQNGRSLGRVQTRRWNSTEWSWKDLGTARGAVTVPSGQEAYLIADPPAGADLKPLRSLNADDLQSLSLARCPVDDAQLRQVAGLTGLRTLDLRQTPITDQSIEVLAKLTSLRTVVLPPQISDSAKSRLQAALPQTNIRQDAAEPVSLSPNGLAQRTLTFPDTPFGLLMTRPWDLPVWNWNELGLAQGAVEIPANQEVLLVVYPAWKRDLSPLDKLEPDDLQSLHLRAATIDDTQLTHIGRLTGLRTLDLRDTDVTEAGLIHLHELVNLRKLWLPRRLRVEESVRLQRHLPDCQVYLGAEAVSALREA